MVIFFTSGKRWCGVHDGNNRLRIWRIHTSSWWELYYNVEDKYLPAVNDSPDKTFFMAQPKDTTLTDQGSESFIILGGENSMVYFTIDYTMVETPFRFLTDVFRGAPHTNNNADGIFYTKTGFCRYGLNEGFRNFEYCANISWFH
jgi:hypothetical protein